MTSDDSATMPALAQVAPVARLRGVGLTFGATRALDGITVDIPAGRMGVPDDLAGPILLLVSDAGRYIVGHTLVAVPYVLRTTLAVLANFDRRIEEAAAVLGAGPVRVFFEVTLPLIRPGVIAGGIFAFIVSFDQFPISLFLVPPKGETLPVVLFNYMRFDLDGAIAAASMVSILMALGVVLLAVTLACLWLLARLFGRTSLVAGGVR